MAKAISLIPAEKRHLPEDILRMMIVGGCALALICAKAPLSF